jgi:ketosteroid isomerase-like protein
LNRHEWVANALLRAPGVGRVRARVHGRFATRALLLVAVTLGACAGNDEAIGRGWVEALNTRNPENVIRLLAPEATYTNPMMPLPIPTSVLRTALENGWKAFNDRHYFTNRIVASGNSVAIEWHIEQTSPKGRAIPVDGVTVLDIADGRIVAARDYFDPSGYVRNYMQPQTR